jgi:hypothetical protein
MPKKAAKAAKAAAAHTIPTPTNPAAAAALAAAGAELKDLEGKRGGLVEELRVVEKQAREGEVGERRERERDAGVRRPSPLNLRASLTSFFFSILTPQIYDLETRYLASANPQGNALKGNRESCGGGENVLPRIQMTSPRPHMTISIAHPPPIHRVRVPPLRRPVRGRPQAGRPQS